MRITKDFAPITMKIETKEEFDFFKRVLQEAYNHQKDLRLGGQQMTDLQERIQLFGKDLGVW